MKQSKRILAKALVLGLVVSSFGVTLKTEVKAIMDNLTYYGDINGFIVVTPNGKASASGSVNSFYNFAQIVFK